MADAIELTDSPEDFAAVATRIATTDTAKIDPPTPAAKKEEATQKQEVLKSKIPDHLFDGIKTEDKKDDGKKETTTKDQFEIDKIADPVFKDAARKAQWDEVKNKGKEFEKKARENEKKAADLEAKIKEFEARGKDSEALQTKLDDLEKKNQEYLDLVRKVNVEIDPEFRSKYVDGRNTLIGKAKTIVEESGGNPKDIETALNLTGKSRVDALSAVAETLSQFQSSRLGKIIEDLTDLDTEAASKRSSPEQYLQQREQMEKARAKKEDEEGSKAANLAFDSALSKASSELEVFRQVDGMEEWNKTAQDIQRKAKELWQNNRDPEVAARKIIDGFTAPVYRDLFLEQRKESKSKDSKIAELEKELKGLYGNSPRISGASATKQGGAVDFVDHYQGLVNGTIAPGK